MKFRAPIPVPSRVLSLVLALVFGGPACAQTPAPLVLGLYFKDMLMSYAGKSFTQHIIHPAVMFDGKAWVGLDRALSSDPGEKPHRSHTAGLPPFAYWHAKDPVAAPQRVPLSTLAGLALRRPKADLRHWFGTPRQGEAVALKGLAGLQTRWGCEEGWGVEVAAPKVEPDGEVVSNQPLALAYFAQGPASRVNEAAWAEVKAAWKAQEPKAVSEWKRQEGGNWRGVPPNPEARDRVPLEAVKVHEVRFKDGRWILAVSALRHFGKARKDDPDCKGPTAVLTALLCLEAGQPLRILRAEMDIQACGDGWIPMAREAPLCLFEWMGRTYFLQSNTGLESSSVTLFELHPKTGLSKPLANGAGAGC